MASPVAYNFEPNTDVYVIHECNGKQYVASGIVLRTRIYVLVTETQIVYDIRLPGSTGTFEFEEADVFIDKATAIAEYELRVD